MGKHAVRFLIVSCLFGLASLFKKNIYISKSKTWSEARKYCRKHHTDLIEVSSLQENTYIQKQRAWIGLYKDDDDVWKWVGGGHSRVFNESADNPGDDKRCVVISPQGWKRINCKSKEHFHCFTNKLILMKENKTWEQALTLCRNQHADLVSLPSNSVLLETLNAGKEAQTRHVWTGLRYLADTWLWVNGDDLEYQVWRQGETPRCSTRNHHCGALSLVGQHWESWDCTDKLNFICY